MGKRLFEIRCNITDRRIARVLDPNNSKIQLDTIMKAASVLGREVRLELV